MALARCDYCSKLISENAEVCPNCGGKSIKFIKAESSKTRLEYLKDIGAVVGTVVVVAGFFYGLNQYTRGEQWKRTEFVANQIKEFNADEINQAVLQMIDYDPARIKLYRDREKSDQYVNVEFESLTRAMKKERDFTPEEFEIRKYVEYFFKYLVRFEYYIETDMISPEQLCADFEYPIALITGRADIVQKKKDNSEMDILPFVSAVEDYLKRWDGDYTKKFFKQIRENCDPDLDETKRAVR